uniref:Transmembrane protein n=1 Tax=Ascaris lumbricoides TaxID=6252 RepID=A0A0M3IAF3_ASCLU
MAVIKHCQCHPLYTEFLEIDPSKMRKDFFSYNHIACTEVKYSGNIDHYILPQEFQTTTDFFTKLTIAYETMLISERLKKIDLNIYELISSIGYNLAFWFSCGHIIWSLFRMCHDFCSIKSTDETKKRNSVLPLLVQPENRTNSDATQRRRLDVEPVIAEPVVATSPRVTSANNDHAIPHK